MAAYFDSDEGEYISADEAEYRRWQMKQSNKKYSRPSRLKEYDDFDWSKHVDKSKLDPEAWSHYDSYAEDNAIFSDAPTHTYHHLETQEISAGSKVAGISELVTIVGSYLRLGKMEGSLARAAETCKAWRAVLAREIWKAKMKYEKVCDEYALDGMTEAEKRAIRGLVIRSDTPFTLHQHVLEEVMECRNLKELIIHEYTYETGGWDRLWEIPYHFELPTLAVFKIFCDKGALVPIFSPADCPSLESVTVRWNSDSSFSWTRDIAWPDLVKELQKGYSSVKTLDVRISDRHSYSDRAYLWVKVQLAYFEEEGETAGRTVAMGKPLASISRRYNEQEYMLTGSLKKILPEIQNWLTDCDDVLEAIKVTATILVGEESYRLTSQQMRKILPTEEDCRGWAKYAAGLHYIDPEATRFHFITEDYGSSDTQPKHIMRWTGAVDDEGNAHTDESYTDESWFEEHNTVSSNEMAAVSSENEVFTQIPVTEDVEGEDGDDEFDLLESVFEEIGGDD